MTCECGLVVKVGTGGEANLMSHRKGSRHRNAMQKLFPDESTKKFMAFSSVPKPEFAPGLSPLLMQLKDAIARIPSTVPKAIPNDTIAMLSTLPVLDSTLDDQWKEVFDPVLNKFLGYGKSVEKIKSEIRTGSYGTDGAYNWLCFCITKAGVGEELLEGKIRQLIGAINELYVLFLTSTVYDDS
ncbi:hypothetical protein Clacol_010053 [Clathrus columnatus]|uniref:Uncharacterized protein n=1 Tax=Clathrus columnatus TaxID=1419009 RepID=A0AAV5AV97_9AGAM|nr:hypothetical protein Clacol_010053 [Clathrus columnatus]